MPLSRRTWAFWIVGSLATLPASGLLWLVGAMAAGGGEIYDPPPPPAFVDPGFPGAWVLIALSPTLLALVGGYLGIRHRWNELFMFALTAPYLLALIGVVAILAID
jgi:hypothetical protein